MSSHASEGLEALAILSLLSLLMLWLSARLRSKERLVSDLPNSKVQGVFIGLVELKVTAETEKPLTSYITGHACVEYRYAVDEEWRRTVVESYTDDKGRSQTRTRVEEGWTTIASGGECEPFYGKDDTGVILIKPAGATFEHRDLFDTTCTLANPLYLSKAPLGAIANSTGVRRFSERWIPLHAPLFVVGQSREREDVVAPEIAAGKDVPLFLISALSQQAVERGYALKSWLAWAAGLALAAGAGHFGRDALHPGTHWGLAVALGAYLLFWGLSWAWMVYNSLVGLRARVRQAWSLIDVELKRRSDLIPRLVTTVSALAAHEAGLQEAIAALRSQASGAGLAGVAGVVSAVAEKYPKLVAQEGFSGLQKQLVETEQRIALARGYYNDIATHFATRAAQIPDAWLAAIGGLKPEPLLQAEGFERAPVKVSLAGT
jgi:hypothetical protein